MQIYTILKIGLSIISFKGSHVEISKLLCTLVPEDCI